MRNRDLETYQVNPNYNYYFSGSDIRPNAIIGVDKGLTVEPALWEKVEVTPKKFRELVMGMSSGLDSMLGESFSGFALFDDKGKQIGVWYSLPDASNIASYERRSHRDHLHTGKKNAKEY